MGACGLLDLPDVALQLGKRRAIVSRRRQPLGDAEEPRKVRAHPG
jgi:hypothetical protein